MKKIKEDDYGLLEYVDCGNGAGFWSRIEDSEMVKERVPIACSACGNLTDNWSISFINRNGACANCSLIYLEDKTPEGEYKSRFPQGFFKNRDAKVLYIKEKIAAKSKNK